jgi:hypothetical protein
VVQGPPPIDAYVVAPPSTRATTGSLSSSSVPFRLTCSLVCLPDTAWPISDAYDESPDGDSSTSSSRNYGAKYSKATECLAKDRAALLAF